MELMEASGAFEVLACGLRPEGSLAPLAVLVAFVLAAGWLAPSKRRRAARR
jgi:hypothetical protein